MSRPRSAGSVFWGLILITTGMILLLKNLGYEIPIWTGVARYWPVLLILWGVIKLVDYARWKRAGEPGPLFGAGEIVLLIVVILSGTALTAAANMSPDFGALFEMANIDIFDITGASYQYTEHYEKDVPAGSTIEVINRYGNVTITPSETDHISVDVAKTVIARNPEEANELEKLLTYSIVEQNGRYQVISTFNRDQNTVRGRRFKTSLTIKVPKKSSLDVNNRNGNVEISDLIGDQIVRNGFGRVFLTGIAGAVQIDNRNDTVDVENIMGEAKISNEFGNVQAKRVSGDLTVRNRNSNVEIEEVRGNVKVNNSFGEIDATDVGGSLDIDTRGGDVDVSRVEKEVSVKARFQSVKLTDVKGSVDVDNQNGEVSVTFVQPPRNNVRLNSKFADIRLVVPTGSSFSMDARTRFASISSDFTELAEREEEHSQRRTLTGQVGTGGPQIFIENQSGDIHIEK
jgi:hypothetical protein